MIQIEEYHQDNEWSERSPKVTAKGLWQFYLYRLHWTINVYNVRRMNGTVIETQTFKV